MILFVFVSVHKYLLFAISVQKLYSHDDGKTIGELFIPNAITTSQSGTESILSRQITGESYTHVSLGKIDWGVNYALGYNNSGESLLSGGSHIYLGVNDWGVKYA